MNTEFPSRVPTVKSTNTRVASTKSTSSSSSTKSSDKPSAFEEQVLSVVKNVFSTLRSLTDKATDFVNRNKKDKDDKDKKKDKKEKDKPSESGKFTIAINKLLTSYKDSIKNLQRSTDNISDSIGSAIGNVFGSGLFGKILSNIITKSLSLVFSKLIVGVILGNPLLLGIIAGIAGITYLVVKYWKNIMQAIHWVGNVISEGIEWILDALPFTKSKAERASSFLSEKTGVSEFNLKQIYGDTEEGREKMIEDWKKAREDPVYLEELSKQFAGPNQQINRRLNTNIERLFRGESVLPVFPVNDNASYLGYTGEGQTPYESFREPSVNYTPVINNVNNNSNVVSGFGDNVSKGEPYGMTVTNPSTNMAYGIGE